ncbi:MAG TPA: SRPBCC family protein [Solirubrobacterales bacterium]
MRLKESIVVSASPEQVWDYLEDPANWLHFMSGVTRWEVRGDTPSGLGARYRMLIKVGSAEVGGLVEMVEWDRPRDLAWNSVTGVDQRGRFRLREVDEHRTRVELRYSYGIAGSGIPGLISEWVSAPTISSHLRRSLHQLKRQVEHEKLRAEAARRRAEREAATTA